MKKTLQYITFILKIIFMIWSLTAILAWISGGFLFFILMFGLVFPTLSEEGMSSVRWLPSEATNISRAGTTLSKNYFFECSIPPKAAKAYMESDGEKIEMIDKDKPAHILCFLFKKIHESQIQDALKYLKEHREKFAGNESRSYSYLHTVSEGWQTSDMVYDSKNQRLFYYNKKSTLKENRERKSVMEDKNVPGTVDGQKSP